MALGAALLWCPALAWGAAPEYKVKGEFLERFTRFVEWPDDAFAGPEAPFIVCTLGKEPFGKTLDELVARGIQGRRSALRRLDRRDRLEGCHLLFIAATERDGLGTILEAARELPVLTVADTPGFARLGVGINLFLEEGRVRFEVNANELKRSRLKASSGLLRLARLVSTEDRP